MNEAGAVAWVDGARGDRTGEPAEAVARVRQRGFAVRRVRAEDIGDEIADRPPDCVVCDADSCLDGIAAIRTVHEVDPTVAVVALARDGDESLAHRAVAAGATEYVPSTDAETIVEAVDRATERGRRVREHHLESRADRAEEFASVVAHDLRNPLGAVRHRIEMARRTGDDGHLDDALAALDRTDELLGELVARARADPSTSDFEGVSLAAVARAAWEHVPTGESTLSVADDWTIAADRERLTQLLENLFVNAVEHGTSEESVGVEVRVGVDDDGCLYVEDDGRGIPVEDRGSVFESGYSTGVDGTGYGLVSVRRIASAHGWTVEVTESADGGARFEFRGVAVGDS
ncbi:sensor histidine kinase [Halosimplex sp. TS25]|uniref:sensor histidine kinase n=1 Tax=Halosimplex rarum TaxID=3396619 RepID=UPI0039E8C050